MCKIYGQWEAVLCSREVSSVLSDDLDGWDGVGERFKREMIHVFIWLVHYISTTL